MTLIECAECRADVSDKAAACPHCGYPMGPAGRGSGRVKLIEKTGRGWKAIRVLGWLLILGGALALHGGRATHDSRRALVGWWIAAAGVACLVTSRAGAWSYHG